VSPPVLPSVDVEESQEGKKILPPLEPALPEGLAIFRDPALPKPKEPVFPEPVQDVIPSLQNLESLGGPAPAQKPFSPGGLDDLVQPEHILPPKIEPQIPPPAPDTPRVKPAPPNLLEETLKPTLPNSSAPALSPQEPAQPKPESVGGPSPETPERLVELARDFYLTPLPQESGDEAHDSLVMKDTDMPWLEKLFYPENEPKPLFPEKVIPPPTEDTPPQ
jgi:hypothetical protein